jgi:dTDP-4-amino-4,6-dideoxygalactose transaminase
VLGPGAVAAFAEFLRGRADASFSHSFHDELVALLRCGRLTLTGSGSDAMLAAAQALAERAGGSDRKKIALAPGLSAPTAIVALQLAGFDVRLVDVDPETFGADPDAVARAIDERPEGDVAVICVGHLLGFPARVDTVAEIAADRKIPWILQDARETLALRLGGYPIHAWCAITVYGFDEPSHLSAGSGGAIAAEDRPLQRILESVAHEGRACTHAFDEDLCEAPPKPDHLAWRTRRALDLSMSDLCAAFGLFSLESLPSEERRRASTYGLLYERLTDHPKVSVFRDPFSGATPRAFPVRVRSGVARPLVDRLLARGVEVGSLLEVAPFELPAFASIARDDLSACKSTLAATFTLPVDPRRRDEEVEAMAKIVAEEASRG